jgi:hypothetical protein
VTDANGQKLARVEIFNKSTNSKMFTDANGALKSMRKVQALILYSLKRDIPLLNKTASLLEV